MSLKALDQDDGQDARRPNALLTKRNDQSQRIPRMLAQPADAARIQDQHEASAYFPFGTTRGYSLRDGRSLHSLPRRWPTYAFGQISGVLLAPGHELAPVKLRPNRLLKQLRRREATFLHCVVKVVRQIDLHTRHAPNIRLSVDSRKTSREAVGSPSRGVSRGRPEQSRDASP